MKIKYAPGILNDVIGPVMRGPSSSHTAAAHRIGKIIRQTGEKVISKVIVSFDRTSSLATTYLSQGSAMGLTGGLLGLELTDSEIINYNEILAKSRLTIEYIISDIENKHPNAYQINVQYLNGDKLDLLAISTGGGSFEIIKWNGFNVSIKGEFYETLLLFKNNDKEDADQIENYLMKNLIKFRADKSKDPDGNILVNFKSEDSIANNIKPLFAGGGKSLSSIELNPVMPAKSAMEILLPFTTVSEMLVLAKTEKLSLSALALLYESARTGLDSDSIKRKMEEIVLIVKKAIDEGLNGTSYDDRILQSQSTLIKSAEEKGLIEKDLNSTIIAYTSAIMEVKSSMGLIVAIPTAGSCGVVGGALFGSLQDKKFDLQKMINAFLAAGIAGVFIASSYTFSAEEGGCQVETGSAAAMAAAGLVELNGGNAEEAINAASMALQNQLGLICDPVAVRVEVPCLGKNIMAASNAYNSYIMAVAGFDPVIPYDEVIDAMKAVGKALPKSLCCTGMGGLAQTPTAKLYYEKNIASKYPAT